MSAAGERESLPMVAALYVETGGVYFGLEGVDPWDEARDARLYAGPWPVVAHPPCARWCQLAHLIESLHADRLGDKYRVGNDGGCFAAALAAVREFGGVLEHPAYSIAWAHFGLPSPGRQGWTTNFTDEGWTTEVSQSAYGHATRKRTWLYYVGPEPPPLRWTEPPVKAQVSAFGIARARERGLALYDKGKSNRTPDAFRDALLGMARSACKPVYGDGAAHQLIPAPPHLATRQRPSCGPTPARRRAGLPAHQPLDTEGATR